MLSEVTKGKGTESVMNLGEDDVLALFGGSIDPERRKCALLPLNAIKKGIREFEQKRK